MNVLALPMWRYPVGDGAKRTRSINLFRITAATDTDWRGYNWARSNGGVWDEIEKQDTVDRSGRRADACRAHVRAASGHLSRPNQGRRGPREMHHRSRRRWRRGNRDSRRSRPDAHPFGSPRAGAAWSATSRFRKILKDSVSLAWTAAAGRPCCATLPAIAASPSSASRIRRAGTKATRLTSNGAVAAAFRGDAQFAVAMGPADGPSRPPVPWSDEIRFTGRGDGYFNNFRGPDEVLQRLPSLGGPPRRGHCHVPERAPVAINVHRPAYSLRPRLDRGRYVRHRRPRLDGNPAQRAGSRHRYLDVGRGPGTFRSKLASVRAVRLMPNHV